MLVTGGLVLGIVIALSFFVRGFDSSGSGGAAALPTGSANAPAPTPTVPTVNRRGHKGITYAVPGGPVLTMGAEGGGIVIDTRNQHRLTATVTSSAPLYAVGYLIPTSLDAPYGKVMRPGRRWSVTTTVVGKPYYAVIWVWAGKGGAPATCSITIDGRVRVTKTTVGSYGRQVCYA